MRIDMDMTIQTAIMAICRSPEGFNPGAISFCAELVKHGVVIDPDSAFGPWSGLMELDEHGIYGERAYMLWNDVCGRDVGQALALFRASQMGLLRIDFSRLIDAGGEGLCWTALFDSLKKELPNFDHTRRATI